MSTQFILLRELATTFLTFPFTKRKIFSLYDTFRRHTKRRGYIFNFFSLQKFDWIKEDTRLWGGKWDFRLNQWLVMDSFSFYFICFQDYIFFYFLPTSAFKSAPMLHEYNLNVNFYLLRLQISRYPHERFNKSRTLSPLTT